MHYRDDSGQPIWLYHGRRDGSGKDVAMYCAAVDLVEAVSTSGKTHNREVYYRMPFKFGQKLGKRTRYKTFKFELFLNQA